MLKIHHLLNPEQTITSVTPDTSSASIVQGSQHTTMPTRSSHTAFFAPGQVNYPPFEIYSDRNGAVCHDLAELARNHDAYKVALFGKAAGKIQDHPRRIPYSSEIRGFYAKTGRVAFEVYEYQFELSGFDKPIVVKWDYQNGLVRVTPFFKACGFSKTIPKTALTTVDVVLQDELSYNVTGGSVHNQGYWVPYHCARALCATFCWRIRWALTPVFGLSFVHECIQPDSPGFGKFLIDPQLIKAAAVEAKEWKRAAGRHQGAAKTVKKRPRPVDTTTKSTQKSKRAKTVHRPNIDIGYDDENLGYGPDSPPVSPKTIPRGGRKNSASSSTWTAINKARDSKSLSPDADTMTPLALPAPVMLQPATTSKGSQKKKAPKDKKGKGKATSKSQAAAAEAVAAAEQDAADEAYYGSIENYVIHSRSVSPALAPPPRKKAKQTHGEHGSQVTGTTTEVGGRTLSQAELTAVEALLMLFEEDSQLAKSRSL